MAIDPTAPVSTLPFSIAGTITLVTELAVFEGPATISGNDVSV